MSGQGNSSGWLDPQVDRRTFLEVAGSLASAAAAVSVFGRARCAEALTPSANPPDVPETDSRVEIKYSVCQMCHGRCGVRAEVKDGVLIKLDGNPYHPNNMHPDERLPYATPPEVARTVRGRLCLKGQSGIQTLYDPYRIKQPLKRVGPRGSRKWEAISWEQALGEIAARLVALRDMVNPANPDAPEAGKAVNQVLFSPGRSVEKDFSKRIFRDGFGTINASLDHTSICEEDHHVAYELLTWNAEKGKGLKNHFKPDILACEFAILFGSNPLEANFALVPLARKLMEMKARGGRYVVVDPRFSNSAAQAHRWVPILPGTDGALALGMARVMVDQGRHDAVYLANANKKAAADDGERTWTDATWLVVTEPGDAEEGRYLRQDPDNKKQFVVWSGAGPVVGTTDDAVTAVEGVLETGEVVAFGKRCKSVFTLLEERLRERSVAEYAAICGLDAGTIESLAYEFTAHGKRAATEHYRGVVQHTNGAWSSRCVSLLDVLIGNFDWKGGSTSGGGSYPHNTGIIDVTEVPNKTPTSGVRIDRAKASYETDGASFFGRDGYPARRPWFPFASHGNYQEIIPSAARGYPYQGRALITYWNAWPYSVPGGRRVFEEYVRDESRLPLFVAISLIMGEVAALADYVLPDTTYLEKFAFPGMTPSVATKGTSFQQPVVGSFDGEMSYTPALPGTKMYVDILIELGKRMGIPGVGANAFADGGSLDRAWDYTRRQLDNLAANASAELGRSVTRDEIMTKGGVFEDPGNEHDGAYMKHGYGGELHIYSEALATTRDSMTGEYFDPLPKYDVIRHSDGVPVNDGAGYPYRLVTYKSVRHGQARTVTNPWLMLLAPENFVELASADAAVLGVVTGDMVKVISPSNSEGMTGRVRVREGLRPGVVAISHHYGHWELASRRYEVDGVEQGYDPSRGTGLQPNPLMRLDARLGDVSLQSKLGGSCAFYDTFVRVEKA